MGRDKTDHSNGKIYTLRSPHTDKFYIGSTTQRLSRRLSMHKADYVQYGKGTYHYVTSFELFKLGSKDVYIELLELCPTNNRMELEKREGELQRENKEHTVNKLIASGLPIKERQKLYRTENKEKLSAYRENNRATIRERDRNYYHKNRGHVREALSEPTVCECGGRYTGRHKSDHMKTKKHIDFTSSK
jgi:hypothetical protein